MDAKAASLRQKRQRFQCGRGFGKGRVTQMVTDNEYRLNQTPTIDAGGFYDPARR